MQLSPYTTLPWEEAHPEAEQMGVHPSKPEYSFDFADVLRPSELAHFLRNIEDAYGDVTQQHIYAVLRSVFVNHLETFGDED
jgi:hypothetical protein